MSDATIAFYEENARRFFERTVTADMSAAQARFAGMLPADGRVLDAGCGSGRDARAFREMGFAVTATEAAEALAVLAREHAGVPVEVLTFEAMTWREAFDGVWANASLLHVPRAELPDAIGRLREALVPGGALYMSFKLGAGERDGGGRHFTDLDAEAGRALVAETGGLTLLDVEVSEDGRAEHAGERWVSLWCRRSV